MTEELRQTHLGPLWLLLESPDLQAVLPAPRTLTKPEIAACLRARLPDPLLAAGDLRQTPLGLLWLLLRSPDFPDNYLGSVEGLLKLEGSASEKCAVELSMFLEAMTEIATMRWRDRLARQVKEAKSAAQRRVTVGLKDEVAYQIALRDRLREWPIEELQVLWRMRDEIPEEEIGVLRRVLREKLGLTPRA